MAQDRLTLNDLPPVPSTLSIPLIGRACAREQYPRIGFSDPKAEELVSRLEFRGFSAIRKGKPITRGTIHRTVAFDEVTRDFLKRHPNGRVLTLGCGLCTRQARLRDLGGRWVDVDYGEVIALRRSLLGADHGTLIEGSLTEERVLQEAIAGDGPALVILEGVLMWLKSADVDPLLGFLAKRLPKSSELVFDVIHPAVQRIDVVYQPLVATRAKFGSGMRSPEKLGSRIPGLELIEGQLLTKQYDGIFRVAQELARIPFLGQAPYDIYRFRVI